jgi:hypothetical protein
MKELKLTRSLLSGYYISVMISFFLFQLIKEPIVNIWTTWFMSFLKSVFKVDAASRGVAWLSLIFICFVIVFIVRRFVVEVLNLYSDDEKYKPWESGLLALLIFGFYIYVVNQVFDQPMPREWFPDLVIKLLGGTATGISLVTGSTEDRNLLTIVPWLWTIGPLAFMYVRTITSKFQTGDK